MCANGPSEVGSFDDLELTPQTREALRRLGFATPTPIQSRAIPHGLAGRDVIGKAQTGTGKTLAFGIPLVQRLDATRISAQALVLLPTRELAQQVVAHLGPLAEAHGLRTALVVGGEKTFRQRPRIPGRQIIVGTPGRVLDFLRESFLHLEWAEYLVLDEFDRMLDLGFIDDVSSIVSYLPDQRQTMLFSATTPPESLPLARKLTRNPAVIEVGLGLQPAEKVEQRGVRVPRSKKLPVLLGLLEEDLRKDGRTVLVFCNTKRAVSELDRELWGRSMPSAAISGDYDQTQRFAVMSGFREGRIRVLVATDVASRGLDIDHVGHVINYDVPLEVEDYVHRLGRTGRAGREGLVTTLVAPDQERSFSRILKRMGARIRLGRVAGGPAERSGGGGGGGRQGGRGRRGDGPPRSGRGRGRGRDGKGRSRGGRRP